MRIVTYSRAMTMMCTTVALLSGSMDSKGPAT
jgi:hypothetical protein